MPNSAQPQSNARTPGGNPPAAADDPPPLTLPDTLREAVQQRLALFRSLDELEAERAKLLKNPDLPADAKAELQRQSREVLRMPAAAQARQMIAKQQQTLTRRSEQALKGEAPPPNDDYLNACKLAVRQWKRLIDGDARLREVLKRSAAMASDEPLYAVLRKLGIAADDLFGFLYYYLALEAFAAEVAGGKRKAEKAQEALPNESGGLLDVLKKSHEPTPEEKKIQDALADLGQWSSAIERERRTVEAAAVEAFWSVYDSAAKYWIAGKTPPEYRGHVRAFLRWGLVSTNPSALDPGLVEWMLAECGGDDPKWSDSMTATHVLYADEYLYFAGQGVITPSFDEDLELNERNSPAWNADKAHRRAIFTRISEAALRELYVSLAKRVKQLRREQARADVERKRNRGTDPVSKRKAREWSDTFQACRVEAGRLERAAIRIRNEYVPRQAEIRRDSLMRLKSCGARLTRNQLVQREVEGVRRASKLVNQLKEPFLPMALRERFRPEMGGVNLRESAVEVLKDLESRDPTVFKVPLMPARKQANEIHLRYSPIVVLTPSIGAMGFSWNPRSGSEVGRIAMPGYCPRGGLAERMLIAVLADFRWDTSKATGGVDQLKSDTLCAEYCTVRWNYRKRAKEIREKAAIYTDQNDRANWRRHYELYMISAMEGGKRLFYKCPDVYETIVRYLQLPDGVERCRHA